ncbi:hypothetical protein Avbf_01143 [Armadillidium vulgare]|nr:hypothetical protein Avbf_01143 [Armadillidium vulgare]
MARLVPLDGSHPLFLQGEKFGKLRQQFILDHLILEPINIEAADGGIFATTLSGKNVFIQRDSTGSLYVNNVRVKKRVSLADGHDIFVLASPLFDQTAKIRDAFNEYHNIQDEAPVGPPLDIPNGPHPPPIPTGPSVIRAPAPPNRIAKPPAPPKKIISSSK